VVGLVAARLRERYERPAFAIALEGDIGTGSGRSVPGVDLGRVVRAAVEAGLLVKGGGHAMAAGVTLRKEQLPAFERFLHQHCGAAVDRARGATAVEIDATLAGSALDAGTVAMVERAGPFGAGNPEPVFALPTQRVTSVVPVGADHLRVTAQSAEGLRLTAMAFRAARTGFGSELKAAEGRTVHLAGHLALSRWGGEGQPEMRLVDAALPETTRL
jgi:single-stranded-DNA-specific exonuclease